MNLRVLLKKEWLLLLGALALLGAAALYFWVWRPTNLTVGVATRDEPDVKLMQAFAGALAREDTGMRLRLVTFDDVRDTAEALRAKKVDLAVVRPDVLLPENGATLALLRQQAAIIVAPQANKITDMAGLAKKRLGLVSGHPADEGFFADLLGYYDLAPPAVTIVPVRLQEVEQALASKAVDAVAILAVPAGGPATDLVRAVGRVGERKVAVIPLDEGEALSLRFPALGAITIPAGAFGGRPKIPEEEVKTVGTTYRLIARADLSRTTAASVTEQLFTLRPRLAAEAPAANLLKAPDVDSAATATSALLPIHPGAVDFYQREQKSFMDRYGDWIWILLIFGGSAFSGIAGFMQRLARKRRELVDVILDRLTRILAEARQAKTVGDLDKLATELDRLVAHSVRYARHRSTGTKTMSALMLAIDSARAAISDRRRDVLDANTPLPARAGEPADPPRSIASAKAR